MNETLFTNVELYDGTGAPPFAAEVAVRDDKIAAIGGSFFVKEALEKWEYK